jgi:hypothetical protein
MTSPCNFCRVIISTTLQVLELAGEFSTSIDIDAITDHSILQTDRNYAGSTPDEY